VRLVVRSPLPAIRAKVGDICALFDVRWVGPPLTVELDIDAGAPLSPPAEGRFLHCAKMRVDADGEDLRASFDGGVSATFDSRTGSWRVRLPSARPTGPVLADIEGLVTLVLATGWRALGWVPLHAGAVAKDGRCALLCAPSGGGKSSLTVAMVARGWQTLGDDKLLLRHDGRELRALLFHLNLDPRTRFWFPALGDLASLPEYSMWTPKRRLKITSVWPSSGRETARPTHLVAITREAGVVGVTVEPMARGETLSLLLHQTVVPGDPAVARRMVGPVAACAAGLESWRVTVGDDAYRDADALAPLEAALLGAPAG
jgi:hypothetical protein